MSDAAQVVTELGTADIDARLEELLIDGILYAFQEQVSDDADVMLNGFGTVVNALKVRWHHQAGFCCRDTIRMYARGGKDRCFSAI